MGTENYTIQDICDKLNLSLSYVQLMVSEGQLKPASLGKEPMSFSHKEFERFSLELRAKRLAALKEIVRASEEIGLYDDDFTDDKQGLRE